MRLRGAVREKGDRVAALCAVFRGQGRSVAGRDIWGAIQHYAEVFYTFIRRHAILRGARASIARGGRGGCQAWHGLTRRICWTPARRARNIRA